MNIVKVRDLLNSLRQLLQSLVGRVWQVQHGSAARYHTCVMVSRNKFPIYGISSPTSSSCTKCSKICGHPQPPQHPVRVDRAMPPHHQITYYSLHFHPPPSWPKSWKKPCIIMYLPCHQLNSQLFWEVVLIVLKLWWCNTECMLGTMSPVPYMQTIPSWLIQAMHPVHKIKGVFVLKNARIQIIGMWAIKKISTDILGNTCFCTFRVSRPYNGQGTPSIIVRHYLGNFYVI